MNGDLMTDCMIVLSFFFKIWRIDINRGEKIEEGEEWAFYGRMAGRSWMINICYF